MKQNKIKDSDEFELFGTKLIARKSCPKNKIFIINDEAFSGGFNLDKNGNIVPACPKLFKKYAKYHSSITIPYTVCGKEFYNDYTKHMESIKPKWYSKIPIIRVWIKWIKSLINNK